MEAVALVETLIEYTVGHRNQYGNTKFPPRCRDCFRAVLVRRRDHEDKLGGVRMTEFIEGLQSLRRQRTERRHRNLRGMDVSQFGLQQFRDARKGLTENETAGNFPCTVEFAEARQKKSCRRRWVHMRFSRHFHEIRSLKKMSR